MRRAFLSASLTLLAFLIARAPAFAGDVHVSMHDGIVNLSARDATLQEILVAWARAGRTSFVHLDAVALPERLTLELNGVKEDDALAVLLRPLSGYVTVKRASSVADASEFDRIVLVPTSVSNHDSTVPNTTPVFAPQPAAPRPAPAPQTVIVNGVSRIVGPNGALVDDDQVDAPPQRAPQGFTRGDAPPPSAPGQAPPTATPRAPATVGSALPGVVNPPPPPAAPPTPAQR